MPLLPFLSQDPQLFYLILCLCVIVKFCLQRQHFHIYKMCPPLSVSHLKGKNLGQILSTLVSARLNCINKVPTMPALKCLSLCIITHLANVSLNGKEEPIHRIPCILENPTVERQRLLEALSSNSLLLTVPFPLKSIRNFFNVPKLKHSSVLYLPTF